MRHLDASSIRNTRPPVKGTEKLWPRPQLYGHFHSKLDQTGQNGY